MDANERKTGMTIKDLEAAKADAGRREDQETVEYLVKWPGVMTMKSTRYKELAYANYGRACWRIVDTETGSVVGPIYRTKTALLADLSRYAAFYGCDFTVGDEVRFGSVVDHGDADQRFLVLEDNGDRVLVRLLCSLPIAPQAIYLRSDLVRADWPFNQE